MLVTAQQLFPFPSIYFLKHRIREAHDILSHQVISKEFLWPQACPVKYLEEGMKGR